MELNKLYLGDCLELMPTIEDNSIDMVFCDLPYGTTKCSWDVIIPFDALWKQYKRIVKPNGAIVLTASQPFTTVLIASNIRMFRCEWIYAKWVGSNFGTARYQPMKEHENVVVFSRKKSNYYPIMEDRKGEGSDRIDNVTPDDRNYDAGNSVYGLRSTSKKYIGLMRNPSSIQLFNNRSSGSRGLHPTQKPVELAEYFIETYSKEGETVLDNCIGSGTTAIACINKGRNWIGIEKEEKYFQIAEDRIERHLEKMSIKQPKLF